MRLAGPLQNLIDQLLKLPTIGPKTAQRLALYILKLPHEEARLISQAILEARTKVFPCEKCGYLTDVNPCIICQDSRRDDSILCVTEEPHDVIAIERSGFNGRYYVLNKKLNLMDETDIDSLNLDPFKELLSSGKVKEVVLALNPDIDGEIMSHLLAGIAKPYNIRVTYLARGLPVGGDIEFADEITLRRALEGRKEI